MKSENGSDSEEIQSGKERARKMANLSKVMRCPSEKHKMSSTAIINSLNATNARGLSSISSTTQGAVASASAPVTPKLRFGPPSTLPGQHHACDPLLCVVHEQPQPTTPPTQLGHIVLHFATPHSGALHFGSRRAIAPPPSGLLQQPDALLHLCTLRGGSRGETLRQRGGHSRKQHPWPSWCNPRCGVREESGQPQDVQIRQLRSSRDWCPLRCGARAATARCRGGHLRLLYPLPKCCIPLCGWRVAILQSPSGRIELLFPSVLCRSVLPIQHCPGACH
jgi:hypothetical protein